MILVEYFDVEIRADVAASAAQHVATALHHLGDGGLTFEADLRSRFPHAVFREELGGALGWAEVGLVGVEGDEAFAGALDEELIEVVHGVRRASRGSQCPGEGMGGVARI